VPNWLHISAVHTNNLVLLSLILKQVSVQNVLVRRGALVLTRDTASFLGGSVSRLQMLISGENNNSSTTMKTVAATIGTATVTASTVVSAVPTPNAAPVRMPPTTVPAVASVPAIVLPQVPTAPLFNVTSAPRPLPTVQHTMPPQMPMPVPIPPVPALPVVERQAVVEPSTSPARQVTVSPTPRPIVAYEVHDAYRSHNIGATGRPVQVRPKPPVEELRAAEEKEKEKEKEEEEEEEWEDARMFEGGDFQHDEHRASFGKEKESPVEDVRMEVETEVNVYAAVGVGVVAMGRAAEDCRMEEETRDPREGELYRDGGGAESPSFDSFYDVPFTSDAPLLTCDLTLSPTPPSLPHPEPIHRNRASTEHHATLPSLPPQSFFLPPSPPPRESLGRPALHAAGHEERTVQTADPPTGVASRVPAGQQLWFWDQIMNDNGQERGGQSKYDAFLVRGITNRVTRLRTTGPGDEKEKGRSKSRSSRDQPPPQVQDMNTNASGGERSFQVHVELDDGHNVLVCAVSGELAERFLDMTAADHFALMAQLPTKLEKRQAQMGLMNRFQHFHGLFWACRSPPGAAEEGGEGEPSIVLIDFALDEVTNVCANILSKLQ